MVRPSSIIVTICRATLVGPQRNSDPYLKAEEHAPPHIPSDDSAPRKRKPHELHICFILLPCGPKQLSLRFDVEALPPPPHAPSMKEQSQKKKVIPATSSNDPVVAGAAQDPKKRDYHTTRRSKIAHLVVGERGADLARSEADDVVHHRICGGVPPGSRPRERCRPHVLKEDAHKNQK